MILTVVRVNQPRAPKVFVPNHHQILIPRPLHLKKVEVVVVVVVAVMTVVTIPTFWIVLKQNVMNNQMPAQMISLIDTTLTEKNADPMTPNMMKMSGFAALNIWINRGKNSCLVAILQTRVQN